MASRQIRQRVRESLKAQSSNESEHDVVKLIDILVRARVQRAHRFVTGADERYAATLLCVIFDPVKRRATRISYIRCGSNFKESQTARLCRMHLRSL